MWNIGQAFVFPEERGWLYTSSDISSTAAASQKSKFCTDDEL